MTQEERQSFWYNHIQACECSGSKITLYCKQHKLSESQYYSYRKQLKKSQTVHFQEVKQPEVKCIEFKVNGIHIVISKEHLSHFMEALRDSVSYNRTHLHSKWCCRFTNGYRWVCKYCSF